MAQNHQGGRHLNESVSDACVQWPSDRDTPTLTGFATCCTVHLP